MIEEGSVKENTIQEGNNDNKELHQTNHIQHRHWSYINNEMERTQNSILNFALGRNLEWHNRVISNNRSFNHL